LDIDKPSRRTIEEYVSNIRDFLIYLAQNDLSLVEVGPEDVKAYKMFLQSAGVVEEMERLRARWLGRSPRTLYRPDPRDVVMWCLVQASATARPTQDRTERLTVLMAVAGSFSARPRAAYRETYSQDTVALKVTILRSFFNSAVARGALFANPASAVEVNRSMTSRGTRIRGRMFS
jgi:site-specific recombinase XerD